jgi:hypothetical protein
MDSICLDPRAEVLWEDPTLPSTKTKKGLFLQVPLTKANCLFATGQLVPQTKLEAKMTL